MLYAGLDVHKNFVQACLMNELGEIKLEKPFRTTEEGLRYLCKEFANAECVLEASTSAIPVYDYLTEAGFHVTAAHPLKVKAISSARLKTDRVDAKMLAHLLRADLIPKAHIPSKKTNEL